MLEKLDAKRKEWKPEMRKRLAEMILVTDQDALDLMRSRAIEQEVLDMLDGPTGQ